MSLPQFPNACEILTREEAVNAIMTSIAMEETALSHILNAEGEKIQYSLAYVTANTTSHSLQHLLEINRSVDSVLEKISDLQMILKNKMSIAASYAPPPHRYLRPGIPVNPVRPNWQCPPACRHDGGHKRPCPDRYPDCFPPPPPCEPCTSVFSAETRYTWFCGKTVYFSNESCCENGVILGGNNCASRILLPSGRKYRIEPLFNLVNRDACPVCISIELRCGDEIVQSKEFSSDKCHVHFSDVLIWDTSRKCKKNILTVKLLTPKRVTITCGELLITETKDC